MAAIENLCSRTIVLEEGTVVFDGSQADGIHHYLESCIVQHGSLRERVQSLVSLFVPMMQGVLRRAADLSVALEARGYQIEGKQTYLHETSLKRLDYQVLAVVVIVTIGALLV